jgi:hypothetical protein
MHPSPLRKTIRFCCPGLAILLILGATHISAHTTRTWNGSINTDWFNSTAVTIYASTNLSSWSPIYTNAPTNGPILFLDTAATNYRARFYHILEQ